MPEHQILFEKTGEQINESKVKVLRQNLICVQPSDTANV